MSGQLKKYYTVADIDIKHKYCVLVPFKYINGEITDWHEVCATAIEMFGLQGDKYICRIKRNNIEFWFTGQKDALWFNLSCV